MKSSISTFYEQLTAKQNNPTQTDQTSETIKTVAPPVKNTLRYILDDPLNRREKYDGYRWRLVCTWTNEICTNLANHCQLCIKHNAIRKNKPLPNRKRKKKLLQSLSLPTTFDGQLVGDQDHDDDIECIGVFPSKLATNHEKSNENIKKEEPSYNEFAIDFDRADQDPFEHNEAQASTSSNAYRFVDVEYLGSKNTSHSVDIGESLSKNIPPLTDFEEDCLGNLLMQSCPQETSMLDAQMFLHKTAISIVKKNYRMKMDTISHDYFYDFLLRHPNVALFYRRWFSHCKPEPPTTGSQIDTKIWTLAMMIRGTSVTNITE